MNPLPPEDGSFFAMLDQIIQHEPTSLFSAEQLGRLATLGIEKGKPFAPDARMQGIFDKAAQQGTASVARDPLLPRANRTSNTGRTANGKDVRP